MKIDTKRSIVTTTEHTIRLTGKAIVELVNQELKAQGVDSLIPDNATVEVGVPGGGDWSNTSLDIDQRTPVTIGWTERSTS